MNIAKRLKKSSSTPSVPFKNCIAKSQAENRTGITVEEHGLNAAAVAEQLISCFPTNCFLREWGVPLTAIHDTGKISPGFQLKYFREHLRSLQPAFKNIASENFIDKHAEISEAAIRDHLQEIFDDSPSGEIAGAHHGKRATPQSHDSNVYGGKSWANERIEFIKLMEKRFGSLPRRKDVPAYFAPVLAGFVTISDWLASDTDNFPADSFNESSLEKLANDAVTSCGFHKLSIKPGLSFEDVFGFSPRNTQKTFYNTADKPGVYILEAGTGSGKTEAALYAAYKLLENGSNNGIYFALPTKLTSDRIHSRVQAFADKICEFRTPVMLSHGSAWLNSEICDLIRYGGEEMAPGGSWFMPSKRALLAPIGVGTVDQALLAVMNVKHYFVRAFGLAGKVVIIDEVHSYDCYTGTLLDELVAFLTKLGCTVIILSATLTQTRKKELIPNVGRASTEYPLITAAPVDGEHQPREIPTESESRKTIKVRWSYDGSINNSLKTVAEKALGGSCVLWILNTVAKAQEAFKAIRAELPDGKVETALLHSRFTIEKRAEIEEKWMNLLGKNENRRPNGAVLVATQVVEQSVDIDADFIITELAPVDMLIQRMGRLWRHDRRNRPVRHPEILIHTGRIAEADSEKTLIEALGKNNSFVYSPFVLWRTWNTMKNKRKIIVPDDMRRLLENVYDEKIDSEPEFVSKLLDNLREERYRLRRMAGGVKSGLAMPEMSDDEENAPTRRNDLPTIDVLLLKEIDSTGNRAELILSNGETVTVDAYEKNFAATRKLHRNIVSIAAYDFGKKTPTRPKYLAKHFYGNLAVVTMNDEGRLLLEGSPTRLFYREDLGIYRETNTEKNMNFDNFDTGEWDYESCDW